MKIEKIARGIWKFTEWAGLSSNVYLVDVDVPTLIDLGAKEFSRTLVRGLKEIGYTPADIKKVIFTHLHFDHIGDPAVFKNAEFFASETEINDLKENRIGSFFALFGTNPASLMKGIELKPAKTGSTFTIIETPGHTRGSICIWLKEKKILFSGDTLFHNNILGRTDLPNSAPDEYMDSLKKLARFKYKAICPGH